MSRTAAQRANVLDSERSLSDQDVGLLYQIITRAEQNPDVERLPYRALFAAYDEVLAEHGGPEADPDQICMHFLFKMGTGGLANKPLFDKFEHALKEMGIALSFDDTASQIMDSHDQYPAEQEPEVKARYVNRLEDTTQKSIRKRRASFNSIYDYGEDTTRKYGNRPSSRSSMSRLDPRKPDLYDTNDELQFKPTPKNEAVLLEKNELLAKFLEMGRQLMGGLNPVTENQELSYRIPAVHIPKNGHRSSSPRPISRSESEIFRQWDQDQLNRERKEFNPINEEVLENLDPKPSLSDMLRDASSFSTYRKRVAARNLLMYWLEQAIKMRQRNLEMEAAALDQDRATLLRQALDLWRAELEKKRQNSRTKRFFRHLENRAAKARDLYLMTKAFSHWAQLTSDELSKTSAARGHILSIKYFNAWREITAVNGMKAQRFATQGPLDGWRRKVQQIKMLNDQAIATHERHLKQKYIFTLRLNFHLEHSAPAWNVYRLKRTSFLSWIRNLRKQREREVEIDFSLRQELLYATMRTWSYRLGSTNAAQQDADMTYRKKLLGENFDIWSAQAKLQSAAVQTVTMCDKRRLRTSLARWRLRAEAVQQAKDADRSRLLRNAWTTWNDHLRCYALKERIDERLKKEAIYRWVLAERYRLAQRIREQRIQRETYARFIFTVRDTSRALLQREYQYTRHYNKDLARGALDCWKNKFVLQRQREVAAQEFYIPRVEQEGLAIWTSKHNHLQNLDKWSKDARFYFVTTKIVKLWHNATLDACKRRRQEAYAKIRRKVKMNIAANVLRVWREKSHRATNLHTQANELLQTKLLIRSAELFGIWRERFAKIVGDTQDAEVYYHRQLAYRQLVRWMDEFETLRGLEEQAEGLDMIRVSGVASAQLRKLSLRLFQMRSAAEMAESLRDRILRKHHRNMLRNWIDVVRARRIQKEASMSPFMDVVAHPPVTPGPGIAGESKDNTLDISQLGELPEFRLASTTPIATPGYLSSPSRRAARARMLSQMSTTPATPLFTPFATRLRAALDGEGYSTGNKSRSRRGSMGTIVRFAIEDPQSPTEGRKSSTRRD